MKQILFRNRKIKMDQLGMCASALCIIHCIALPVLLILGVESMLWWIEQESLELFLISLSLMIGLISFAGGYLQHRQHFVPVLFVSGFLLLVNGESVDHAWVSVSLSIGGALVIAYAHTQNLKWKRHALAH
ncbi:MAG: MerC domain-containing protein [Cyclobacteriaceae bacterium]